MMDNFSVNIFGLDQALAELHRVQDGAQSFGGYSAQIGSPLAYSWGVHFGRHRGGKLARKAGGLFFLTRALEEVRARPETKTMVAKGIHEGPAGARRAGRTMAFAVLARSQELETAVDSGALRNSLQVVEGGQSARPGGTPFGPARRRSSPSPRTARR
jgi:hypothetical protein